MPVPSPTPFPAPPAEGPDDPSVADRDDSWSGEPALTGQRRRRRVLLWSALVALLVVAQSLLVWLTVDYESNRAQEEVEGAAAGVADRGLVKSVCMRNNPVENAGG